MALDVKMELPVPLTRDQSDYDVVRLTSRLVTADKLPS
jgi:hypothetical protein